MAKRKPHAAAAAKPEEPAEAAEAEVLEGWPLLRSLSKGFQARSDDVEGTRALAHENKTLYPDDPAVQELCDRVLAAKGGPDIRAICVEINTKADRAAKKEDEDLDA